MRHQFSLVLIGSNDECHPAMTHDVCFIVSLKLIMLFHVMFDRVALLEILQPSSDLRQAECGK